MIRLQRSLPRIAFGVVLPPTMTLVVYVGCALWAIPLATEGGRPGAVLAAFLFGFAVLLLAYTLASDTLALAVDARRLCLPGTRSLLNRAKILLCVLLGAAVALPALLLSASGVWRTWVPTLLVLSIAFVGVLGTLWPAAALVMLAAILFVARWALAAESARPDPIPTLLLLICAGMAVAVIAKWRHVVRRAPVLASAARESIAVTIRARRQRESAVEVVRNCLGPPFAQVRPVRRLAQGLVWAACILAVQAILLAAVASGSGRLWKSEWQLGGFLLAVAAAASIWGIYAVELIRIGRAPGVIAELALMPGLGAAAAQRRELYRAVLVPPLPWLSLLFALACLEGVVQGAPFIALVRLALWLLAMWLVYGALAAQIFSASRPLRPRFAQLIGIVIGCLYFAAFDAYGPPWLPWMMSLLFLASGAFVWSLSGRRLRRMPHPFLA